MENTVPHKKSETAEREERVVERWKEGRIFEKSLEKEAPQGEFVFYDGPPFATGLPHMGHLLISAYKDAVGRYKTMRGYRVPRRWGWDCHGLPIENIVEKKLGLATKKDIEQLGIARFNEEARASVLTYVSDWKHYIERIGRWVDFDNSYKTLDSTYIESVWWALKKIHTDGRLYEGRKVLMYCPHCETPLAKAEIAMDNSYKDVTEDAVFVRFTVTDTTQFGGVPTSILAWTTTPWTLPGNVALAVGEHIAYVLVRYNNEQLVLAKERLSVLGNDVEILEEFKGVDLIGTAYEPLYAIERAKGAGGTASWTVLPAKFVTTEDGTGVVHIAPMYGEDDHALGLEHGLPVVPLLNASGVFNTDAPAFVQGMYFKKGGKYVSEDLEKHGLLFASHPHTHSYPHCYRCNTALIYNALTSWFIDIQSVKQKLLDANQHITWHPEHLKEGRFRHNLETAPDWAISRNRFWASPLPIWKHEKTGAVTVLGSLAEVRALTKRSGNTYLFVRHGQAESNVANRISSRADDNNHVTELGRTQAEQAGQALVGRGVTRIITSPFVRTKETAEIIAQTIGYDSATIQTDVRFEEWRLGALSGEPLSSLHTVCPTYEDRFTKQCAEGAETLTEMKARIGEALYELESTYKNETILVVGHEYTVWLAECVARGADMKECIRIRGTEQDFVRNGEVYDLDFVPVPHNNLYEVDLHRPYIDDIELTAPDGARLNRIPEVVDCWMESGAMPFAAEHYPHENKDIVKRRYPGDFIAEYIAQTRTWFYYMHALGVLLFDAPSFKTCVTTGTVLAADGSKMSKSKGNFTDPLKNIAEYGADALRFYMLGSVLMAGEDVAFKDEELREAHNRFINMLWNSLKFYEMNAGETNNQSGTKPLSTNALDRWILARLTETGRAMTEYLDEYDTVRTVRVMRDFATDLSTWYIRRSRDRMKSDDLTDKEMALATTQYVFLTFAKLIAPVTPFIAEDVYRLCGGSRESVHLEEWPEFTDAPDTELVANMEEVRQIASVVLEARQRTGIKVRQPLAKVTLKNTALTGKDELLAILADEVNVKCVEFGSGFDEEVVLDTTLTPELVMEGQTRELLRAVQDARKKAGLAPSDKVTLTVTADEGGKKLLTIAENVLTKTAGVTTMVFAPSGEGTHVELDGATVTFSLERI